VLLEKGGQMAAEKDSVKEASALAGAAATGTGPTVALKDRFEIFYQTPLPSLDTPNATAYAAEDKRQKGRALFALVVTGGMPARVQVMKHLRGVRTPGLMGLVEWGVVEWPPLEAMRVALIYEQPMGGRVMNSLTETIRPITDQHFVRNILRPLCVALGEMHNHGVTHRAIRPTNMYWIDASQSRIVLGDCTTGPAAMDQPAVCEPIESAMCSPEGRGVGGYDDDFYALGVSMVMLLVGRDPTAGLGELEIVTRKLHHGSYATLASDLRLPLNMIEVLRGLLADDVDQRWDFEQADLWFNGRRMSPVQARPFKRAQRAFVFMNQEYVAPRHLAHAMAHNWDKAIPVVLEGKLEIWLRRGLEDNQLADQVAMGIRNATALGEGNRAGVKDVALANVLIVLDRDAPIRYRELRAHLDGIGGVLSAQMIRGKDTRLVTELIMRDIPKMWLGVRESFSPEFVQLTSTYKELREHLQDGVKKGFGLERCLYEMNDNQYCLSPLLAKEFVLEIRDVLPILDKLAARLDSKANPLDRHMTAFIAARFPKDIGPQLMALNEDDPKRATLGMLSLLAVLQWRLGPEAVHGLCGWVGGLIGPVINSYQSRERRRALEQEIPRLVRKGSLPELYNFVDDADQRKADFDEFQRARAEWAMTQQQIHAMQAGKVGADKNAERNGQRVAATGSVGVAIVTTVIVLVGYLI
jgi:hypothetical protein